MTQRCEASTTTGIDNECRTYRCLLPSGHDGNHEGGATIEWTDATTVPRAPPKTEDEKFMTEVASYVGEWLAGDGAWHGAGHIRVMCNDAENKRLRAALEKINAIRNSIVGVQGFNFSEHAYPLVAALDEAGLKGLPYPEARANVGTLIERANNAESENERLRAALGFYSTANDAQWMGDSGECARVALQQKGTP